MLAPSPEQQQQSLIRLWAAHDHAGCAELLAAADAAGLGALARLVLPWRIEGDDSASEALRQQRHSLLQRAGEQDKELAAEIAGRALADCVTPQQWADQLLRFIALQRDMVGLQRERVLEIVVLVHWAINRLLDFTLPEQTLIGLFSLLQHVAAHLSWQSAAPSLAKSALQNERLRLQQQLGLQVARLAQDSSLTQPEALLRFDADGALLPPLAAAIVKLGVRDGVGAALFYFLYRQNQLTLPVLMAQLLAANQRCCLATGGRLMILAGDIPVAGALQTLLEIDDPMTRSLRLGWWLDVNFPQDQLADGAALALRIPAFVRQLLQSDQADLCLSAAGEASQWSPRWRQRLADLAHLLQCRPGQIVYLPQNSAFAAAIPPGDAPDPRIVPLNAHLLLPKLRAEPLPAATPGKKFLCFNSRPHLHRAALLLSLARDGLLADCHFSFNMTLGQATRLGLPVTAARLAPWLQSPEAEIESLIEVVEPSLPLRLDLVGAGVAAASDGDYINSFNAALFADAAVYLVTETEMEDGVMQRFTEKTIKGLASGTPFLLFGNVGTLAGLRALGFQSFAPVIREDYDQITDPVLRFHAAYAELRRLQRMTITDLIGLRQTLQPVLQHNRRHLFEMPAVLRAGLQSGMAAD